MVRLKVNFLTLNPNHSNELQSRYYGISILLSFLINLGQKGQKGTTAKLNLRGTKTFPNIYLVIVPRIPKWQVLNI